MSRSAKIKKPRWTDPEDISYLSLFGTLLHSLSMAEAKIPNTRFELKRRAVPDTDAQKRQARNLFPVPASPVAISDAQSDTLKSIASAATKQNYIPRALPGPADILTIEMMRVSESAEPIYARRQQ